MPTRLLVSALLLAFALAGAWQRPEVPASLASETVTGKMDAAQLLAFAGVCGTWVQHAGPSIRSTAVVRRVAPAASRREGGVPPITPTEAT
jgi:hypothetical protein